MFKLERRTTWITVLCIVLATFGVACLALIRQGVLWLDEYYEKDHRLMARVWQSEAMMAELFAGTRTECQFDNLDPLVRIANSPSHNKVKSARLVKVDLSDHMWGLLRDFLLLRDVAIDSCQGADTLLAEIAGIRQLEHLVITETFISEKGMKSIARFPRLKKLELGRKCRGVSPEALRKNASLESLTLATIDDRWIDVLKTLPNLKTLDIDDADSRLTAEMISRLSKALPQVEWHRVGPIRLSPVREPLVPERHAVSAAPRGFAMGVARRRSPKPVCSDPDPRSQTGSLARVGTSRGGPALLGLGDSHRLPAFCGKKGRGESRGIVLPGNGCARCGSRARCHRFAVFTANMRRRFHRHPVHRSSGDLLRGAAVSSRDVGWVEPRNRFV
ncbi:MAG: hypothetical protein ACYC35_05105 [Pirellulales bacterium]